MALAGSEQRQSGTPNISGASSIGDEKSIWFTLTPMLKNPGNPMLTLHQLCKKYGGVIPLTLKDERLFFVSDVDIFKHVLVTHVDSYVKYFDGMHPIFGHSMITVDGPLWHKIRRPQQAAFHPAKFEEYLPFLLEALRSKAERWEQYAETGETFEMLEETWGLAADMVCRALFDREVPFNPHFVFGIVKAYTNVMEHKAIRQRRGSDKEFALAEEAAWQAMRNWADVPPSVIAAPFIDNRPDTLLKMLQEAEADPEFPEFDRQQVEDEIKLYLWAGTETSALTLAWCLYMLSQKPEIAEKIRDEADNVCGSGEPNWEQAQSLTYTRMVIQETMRMFPPIWSLVRAATRDDELGGHKIKAGDKVVLCTHAVHHSEQFWSDPYEFRPTRFSPERMKARARYSYVPFGAGKRSCIGGALSQLENGLALAQLLRRFRPKYVGEVPAPIIPSVTLTPKGGLPFRVERLA